MAVCRSSASRSRPTSRNRIPTQAIRTWCSGSSAIVSSYTLSCDLPTTSCSAVWDTSDQLPGVGFKTYWETHGIQDPRDVRGEVRRFQDAPLDAYRRSLALFGLPLTPARMETNTSGDTVLTQWFERARFEWHPTNPPGFQVLVGRLGWEVRNNPLVPGPGPTPTRPSGNIECDEIVQISPGLFQCRARFADADHDPFAILITGRSRAAVARFADEMILALNSTMIDAAALPQGDGGTEESIADAVLAEHPENLVIDIAPLRPVSGAFQLEIIVDPYIEQGHKHLYRQRCGTSVRTQVSVYPGGGSVEAALLRGRARHGPFRIGPETPLRLEPSPPSTYEVQITGLGTGSNNYRVSGTWTRVESGGSGSNQRC